jgi:hypothetical protein
MLRERANVPFDKFHFKKQDEKGIKASIQDKFSFIYKTNFWAGNASVSGNGSDKTQTEEIRRELVNIINEFNIKTILDAPCGDFNWMNTIDLNLDKYIGADIVPDIISRNKELYGNGFRRFKVLDITSSALPDVDLLFCRDCLVHLSFSDIKKTFLNIKKSSIKYILTTTFPGCEENEDITTGDWRIINLEKHPFNLPKPIKLINERCTEGNGTYSDKSLGLWNTDCLKY